MKYSINGGITQNILSNNDTISIAQTHQSSGDFNYHLIQVDDANAPYCSQVLDESVNINVLPKPNASIGNSEVVCQNYTDPEILIMGYDGESPYTFYYRINDGQTQTNESSLNNSYILHQSTSIPGSFEYILDSIVDAGILGCTNLINDTVLIKINPLPQAELYGDTSICQNDSPVEVSFKGLDGVLPYTFSYEINGENSGVISTLSTDSLIEIVHNTDSSGVFIYNLISVSDGNSPSCEQLLNEQIVVKVNEIPEAIMLGSTKICQNIQSPRVLFKGNQGIEPYKFEYTINGGSIQTIQTSFNDTVSIPQQTNISGVYIYNLVQVEEGSSTSCFRVKNDTISIEVKSLPNATLEGDVTLCQNDENPEQVFKGFGGEAPYTFKYNINGGEELTSHTDVNDNSSIMTYPTNVSGTYKFNLLNVEEGGELNCAQQQTGSVTININPLPVANFYIDSFSKSILNPQFKFFNSSKNSDYFLWDFGDGETSSEENPYHFFDQEFGEQIITLFVENSFNCKDTVSKQIQIRNDVLLYVPNSFTPNGDKLNDEFKPTLLHQKIEFDEYVFFIFNQWGEIVFESHDIDKGWNGNLGGESGTKCTDGLYIWKISYKEKNIGVRNTLTGHIILLK